MNILVYGAGVIGSVYAARLQEAGQNVTLLARGQRAESVRTHGIQLERRTNGQKTTVKVSVVEQLMPTDRYDIVLITVRADQLHSILPILAANTYIPTLLFLCNNPAGMRALEQIDPQRIVLGFPAIGGIRRGDIIHYIVLGMVPTTLGEVDGQISPRLRQLAAMFKQARFRVALSSDMHTWLKTHALMDMGILTSVLLSGKKSKQLARSRRNVVMLVDSMREGLLALRALGTPLTPVSLQLLFLWFPRWLTVTLFQVILRTRISELSIDPHLDDDLDELHQMSQEIMTQLRPSPVATPTLKRLMTVLD